MNTFILISAIFGWIFWAVIITTVVTMIKEKRKTTNKITESAKPREDKL